MSGLRVTDWNPAINPHITEPGIYTLPAEVYHGDPVPEGSLSASGARKLLPPFCPAIYEYERSRRPTPTDDMSFGHVVHKLVLGEGAQIIICEADSWRTKAAKELKYITLREGNIPVLRHDYITAVAMSNTLKKHPLASALLAPGSGKPEQALFWRDPETGIMCRALLDWLREPTTGRFYGVDFKTCISADPEKISKALYEYAYHRQGCWYLDGIRALGIADKPSFLFIFMEKTPPYLITVVGLDELAIEAGNHYNRQARLTFAECQEAGIWPGYTDDVAYVGLPPYAQTLYLQESGR